MEIAKQFPPLPLMLKDGHYTTMVPEKERPFPTEWCSPHGLPQWNANDTRGGGKSTASSVKTGNASSVKKWLPASSGKCSSVKSWLPASTPACKSASSCKASNVRQGRTVDADSVTSWLPKMSSNASRSTKNNGCIRKRGKQCDPPPAKTGRPPRALAKAKADSQMPVRDKYMTWTCPECTTVIEGKYSYVITGKHHHWKTRHPGLDRSVIMKMPTHIIAMSHELPAEQQAWSCPLCTAALPTLANQDRKRSIQAHIAECHPNMTPRKLFHLRAKNQKKPGVAKSMTTKLAAARAKRHRTHDVVEVMPTEKFQRDPTWRGTKHYCKKCLCLLGGNLRVNAHAHSGSAMARICIPDA